MKVLHFILIIILLASCRMKNNDGQQAQTIVNDSVQTQVLVDQTPVLVEQTGEIESDYKFVTEAISKDEFDRLYSIYYKEYKPKKITDFDSVKKILNGVVEWAEEECVEDGETFIAGHPIKIHCRNGKSLVLLTDEDLQSVKDMQSKKEYGWGIEHTTLLAYFPEEDILLLAEINYGDGGDQSYNLTTGDPKEVAGDPEQTQLSPNPKYRVRAYYNGYNMEYFYQEKKNNHWINLANINDNTTHNIGEILNLFFVTDSTFYMETEGGYDFIHYIKATIKYR